MVFFGSFALSVVMPVMDVRPVGVRMDPPAVPVRVVMIFYFYVMDVFMMQVIMPVKMGMFEFMVLVAVLMLFKGHQHDRYDQE